MHVWLRLTLAAFVLAFYTSIALATGVAHADEGPSGSGGESASSQQSDSGSPGTGATSGTTGTTSNPDPDASAPDPESPSQDDDLDRDATGDTSSKTPKAPGTFGTTAPIGPTAAAGPELTDSDDLPQGTPVGTDAQTQTPVAVDTTTPETPPSTVPDDVPVAIEAPVPADDSQNSRRSGQLTLVTTPESAESPTESVAPSLRSLGPTVGSEPAIASLAAIAPPDPVPPGQRDFGPPLAGLIADVATVAVSAVHTVATSIAQAFGPNSFLGVPYLLATTVANAAAAVGRTIVGAPLFDPMDGPFPVTYGILDGLAFFNPTKPPAGANDPSITVTAEHPLPIILLNGTIATQGVNWSVGAPVLANAGYKVYTFNYGNTTSDPNYPIQSTADIRQSGLELAAEVDRVLAETGAPQVILIGHSQGGGILPVYYINNLDGAAKVSQLIGIAPSNHGTDFNGLIALQSLPIFGPLSIAFANSIGPALEQQTVGSPFQEEVYGNGDTRPGVLYTTIISVNDEVVTPFTQQALTGPNVTNIILQDRYPGQIIGHANIIVSPQAYALVLEALASNPAANPLQHQNLIAA